jgi:hypothetical protein
LQASIWLGWMSVLPSRTGRNESGTLIRCWYYLKTAGSGERRKSGVSMR